jgi:hypothetical protein
MRFLGVSLIFIGVFSILWNFFGMNLIFLQWIDQWGETMAWMIRGAFIVLGAILYFLGKPSDKE